MKQYKWIWIGLTSLSTIFTITTIAFSTLYINKKKEMNNKKNEFDKQKEKSKILQQKVDNLIKTSKEEIQNLINSKDMLETEINKLNRDLNTNQTELEQTRINLNTNQTELEQTRINLNTKQTELEQTRINLNTKQTELEQTRINLNTKQIELAQARTDLKNKENEIKRLEEESIFNSELPKHTDSKFEIKKVIIGFFNYIIEVNNNIIINIDMKKEENKMLYYDILDKYVNENKQISLKDRKNKWIKKIESFVNEQEAKKNEKGKLEYAHSLIEKLIFIESIDTSEMADIPMKNKVEFAREHNLLWNIGKLASIYKKYFNPVGNSNCLKDF